MRYLSRLCIFLTIAAGLAYSAGVRFNTYAFMNFVGAKSFESHQITMKNGQGYSGRILGETDTAITVKLNTGSEIDLEKSEIALMEKSAEKRSFLQSFHEPWLLYEKKKNYLWRAISYYPNALKATYAPSGTPEQEREHAKRWAAEGRWQQELMKNPDLAGSSYKRTLANVTQGGGEVPYLNSTKQSSAPVAPADRRS